MIPEITCCFIIIVDQVVLYCYIGVDGYNVLKRNYLITLPRLAVQVVKFVDNPVLHHLLLYLR